MLNGDVAFILAFIVLPTAILVSSIWLFVLLQKGILLSPRARQAVDDMEPAYDDAVALDDDDTSIAEPVTPAITTAVLAEQDRPLPPPESPVDATLEHTAIIIPSAPEPEAVVISEAPAPSITPEPLAVAEVEPQPDPEPEPLVADTPDDAAAEVIAPAAEVVTVIEEPAPEPEPLPPPVAAQTLPPEPEFPGFEETRELPLIEPVAAAPQPEVLPRFGEPIAGDVPAAPLPLPPSQPTRRKPTRRIGARAAEEPVSRPLAAKRASPRKSESEMEGGDRAVDVIAGDDERDI